MALIVELYEMIPPVVRGVFIAFIARLLWDTFVDRQKQTVKATMLEMFNKFSEKNNADLKEAFRDSHRLASENMIELVKLEKVTERAVEQLASFAPTIGEIVTTLEGYDKRIWKLEQRELR